VCYKALRQPSNISRTVFANQYALFCGNDLTCAQVSTKYLPLSLSKSVTLYSGLSTLKTTPCSKSLFYYEVNAYMQENNLYKQKGRVGVCDVCQGVMYQMQHRSGKEQQQLERQLQCHLTRVDGHHTHHNNMRIKGNQGRTRWCACHMTSKHVGATAPNLETR